MFGHQFASIAGAGPINGPIQTAVFGWVPVQKIIELIGAPTGGNLLQLAFAAALFVLGVIVALLGFQRLVENAS